MTRQLSRDEALAYYREMHAERTELEAIPSQLDGLRLRKVMHARTGIDFLPPRRWFTGWVLDSRASAQGEGHRVGDTRVIVTVAGYDEATGEPTDVDGYPEWVHASISHPDRDPTYAEVAALHDAAFGPQGRSHMLFVPGEEHVNLHEHALHLWGRLDGTRFLPDFGSHGTI